MLGIPFLGNIMHSRRIKVISIRISQTLLQCVRNLVLPENDMLDCVIDRVLIKKNSQSERDHMASIFFKWVSLLGTRLLAHQ